MSSMVPKYKIIQKHVFKKSPPARQTQQPKNKPQPRRLQPPRSVLHNKQFPLTKEDPDKKQ